MSSVYIIQCSVDVLILNIIQHIIIIITGHTCNLSSLPNFCNGSSGIFHVVRTEPEVDPKRSSYPSVINGYALVSQSPNRALMGPLMSRGRNIPHLAGFS